MPVWKLLPALLLFCALPAQAQVYTWVDENGQKHFGSQPPTPEQKVETVNIREGYSSDGQQPAVTEPETEDSTESQDATDEKDSASSKKAMCSAAMRWTKIDIPNLKDIARERKQAGKITKEVYDKAVDALDEAKKHITMQSCLTSEGEDQKRFECLSRGMGIIVCSDALGSVL